MATDSKTQSAIDAINAGNFMALAKYDTAEILSKLATTNQSAYNAYVAYLDSLGLRDKTTGKGLMTADKQTLNTNTRQIEKLEKDQALQRAIERIFQDELTQSQIGRLPNALMRKNLKGMIVEIAKAQTRLQLSTNPLNGKKANIANGAYETEFRKNMKQVFTDICTQAVSMGRMPQNGKIPVTGMDILTVLAEKSVNLDNMADNLAIRFKGSVFGKKLQAVQNKIDAAGKKAFGQKTWETTKKIAKIVTNRDMMITVGLSALAGATGGASLAVLSAYTLYKRGVWKMRREAAKQGISFKDYKKAHKSELIWARISTLASLVGIGGGLTQGVASAIQGVQGASLATATSYGSGLKMLLAGTAATGQAYGEMKQAEQTNPRDKSAKRKMWLIVGAGAAGIASRVCFEAPDVNFLRFNGDVQPGDTPELPQENTAGVKLNGFGGVDAFNENGEANPRDGWLSKTWNKMFGKEETAADSNWTPVSTDAMGPNPYETNISADSSAQETAAQGNPRFAVGIFEGGTNADAPTSFPQEEAAASSSVAENQQVPEAEVEVKDVDYMNLHRSQDYVITNRFGGDVAKFTRFFESDTTKELAEQMNMSREDLINLAARAQVHNPNGEFNTALFKLLDPCEDYNVEMTEAEKLVQDTVDWAHKQDALDRIYGHNTQNFVVAADNCDEGAVNQTPDTPKDTPVPAEERPAEEPKETPAEETPDKKDCDCGPWQGTQISDKEFNNLVKDERFDSQEDMNAWMAQNGIRFDEEGRIWKGDPYKRVERAVTEGYTPANKEFKQFNNQGEWNEDHRNNDMRFKDGVLYEPGVAPEASTEKPEVQADKNNNLRIFGRGRAAN